MNVLFKLAELIFVQIVALFGIFFVFGYILFFLQQKTQSNYRRIIGWKGILLTAWIGTPIHELGHLFFAKLFNHKVTKVNLFRPNPKTGSLGNVDHNYNRRSLYQRIGNFFIGAAPMIFGSFFLVLLLYFIVPGGKEIFAPLKNGDSLPAILNSIKLTLQKLFVFSNVSSLSFWIFLYISFCVSAHIAPSKEDRRAMWSGLFFIMVILLIINLIALWLSIDFTEYILSINQYLGIFFAILIYSFIISFLHLLLSTAFFYSFKKTKGY